MGKDYGKPSFVMGKTMEHHHFSWEDYGKSQFFMGKTMENQWRFNGFTMV